MTTTLKCIVLLNLALISCTNNIQQKIDQVPTELIKFNSDTLIIDKKSAVLYAPDSLQIEKQKAISEQDFYTVADDNLYYMHGAREFLDSIKVTILDARDKRFLKFISSDKTQQIIKLDTLKELWGIYLFDPAKKPKQADILSITEEYNNYFNH